MADFLKLAQEQNAFWHELVERGVCIRKNKNGCYCVYDEQNTPYFGVPASQDLLEVIRWVNANILEQQESPKEGPPVSFLLTAMYNKGFGPEFVDCAVISASSPDKAQAQADSVAEAFFQKKMPKHVPEGARIRPIPPNEIGRYDKLEKIQA